MSQPVQIARPRCEYLVEPLGLDERQPRLSWEMQSERRGARQVAYRIRVASSPEALAAGKADRWDSGRVASAQSTQVAYAGSPLRSRDACHWRVEVEDETGASTSSPAASWTMGLLEPGDWSARWIASDFAAVAEYDPAAIQSTLTDPGTPGTFRRQFELKGEVRHATLYISARGLFIAETNGRPVSRDLFAPEWTDYNKRIHFRTYEVTSLLRQGTNVLDVTLGDGWWSGFVGWQEKRGRYGSLENSFIAQLELDFADGTRTTIGTDTGWRCGTGPIRSSDFMMGEFYDARRVPQHVVFAREVPPPAVKLVAQRSEPIRAFEEFAPRTTIEITPGTWIFDLGQNIAGFVRLKVSNLTAGTRLTLRHGERLNPDGTLYTENLRRATSTHTYIVRGDPEEEFQPHFTFQGFQYVELTGLPGKPSASAITGVAIHSATPSAGQFECSHAGVNRLWLNGVWSQKDNFISVPTDCPQRDERLGWMGDAQVFFRTASYNMDVAAFFTKWLVDVEDAQTPEGIFPDVAPRMDETLNWNGLGALGGSAGWADAGIIIPYALWQVYGDRRILERHYAAMVKWVDWVEAKNPAGLRLHELSHNYGDWLCIPSDTSFGTHSPMKNLLATAYWADDAAKLARIATELGKPADAQRFRAMFERVRAAFQKEWLLPDGEMAVETQTAYLLALAFDLLPENVRTRAAERLVANIRDLDWHLSTGFIGISHLNPQLTLAGHSEVAYRLLQKDDYPSWLYPVKHGATTIWERWNGWTHEDGFFNPQMNSFNHYSLGSVGEWLFRHVAGIELDPEKPGFQDFILRPFIGEGLTFAKATYRTHHGEILSDWKRTGDTLTWEIHVPANCRARVHLPGNGADAVTDGLPITHLEAGFAVCDAPAGHYVLKAKLRG